MKFQDFATGAPRRAPSGASGKLSGSILPSPARRSGAIASLSKSLTWADRERTLPSLSTRPARSEPLSPKRTSFISHTRYLGPDRPSQGRTAGNLAEVCVVGVDLV